MNPVRLFGWYTLHGVNVQLHAGTIFCVIRTDQFFSTDVGVCAVATMHITTCGGSHVPFTENRVPIRAAKLPSECNLGSIRFNVVADANWSTIAVSMLAD